MKRIVMGLLLAVGLCAGTAEASIGDKIKNVWYYLFQPVNCVGNFAHQTATAFFEGIYCVIGNLNRNPVNHDPLIETSTSVDIVETPAVTDAEHHD